MMGHHALDEQQRPRLPMEVDPDYFRWIEARATAYTWMEDNLPLFKILYDLLPTPIRDVLEGKL